MISALFISSAIASLNVSGDFASVQYKFDLDEARRVGISRGTKILIGTIDRHGEFNQDQSIEMMKVPDSEIATFKYSGPKFVMIATDYQSEKAGVYELRSGRLIPGMFGENGLFVPDLDGKIIKFEEYVFSERARPIWNLPGKFVPIKKH